jgi:pilus assembly protein CpaC
MLTLRRSNRPSTARALLMAVLALLLLGAEVAAQQPETRRVSLFVGRSERLDSAWPVKGAALTDPAVADVQVLTPQLVLVSGKAPGSTDLLLWGENGQTGQVRIEVSVDVARLQTELGAMFPGAALAVGSSENVTLVSGTLPRAEQSQQLRSYLEQRKLPFVDQTVLAGVQQVQVQVRMAEVSRTGLRELGLNVFWAGSHSFGGMVVGPSSGGPINPVSIGATAGASALGNVPFEFTQTVNVSPAVTLFAGFPKADVEYFLSALQENEFLRILAEPNLVALSGEEARFLAGGEFPIPVVQGGGTVGGTSVTIEYKEFGVSLNFRPVVQGDGAIRLEVFSEVSDLSDIGAVEIQGFQVPSLVTRNAQTTVTLRSGQTFAMAGLLSQTTRARSSQVPGLGDLPVLGSLFRSTRYKSGETELMLLVTTSLVEPLSTVSLPALPGQLHMPPNDWELYAFGSLEGEPVAAPTDTGWLKELGLDNLKGPGAWSSHDQEPATSTARPEEGGGTAAQPQAETDAAEPSTGG